MGAVSSSVKSGISVPVVSGCCQFFCQEWYKCSCCEWMLSVLLSRAVLLLVGAVSSSVKSGIHVADVGG